MKCKHCGKDLMDGAKFCVYCGKPIEVEEVKEETVPNTIDPFTVLEQNPQEVQQPISNESIADEQLTQAVPTEELFTTLNQKPENTNNQTELVQPLTDSIQEIEEVQQETKVEENTSNIVKEETQSTLPIDNKNEEEKVTQPIPSPIEMPKEPQKQDINIETKIVKKNNPILIVIIFILLAIIIGGGFFVYTKYIESSDTRKSSSNEETVEKDVESNEVDNKSNYNLDELNEKINVYNKFLVRAFYDNKGKNLLDSIELKLELINLTIQNIKELDNGVSQAYSYVSYDDYKKQYEILYGDTSKMDEEIRKLNQPMVANMDDKSLGEGYVSWSSTWRAAVSYSNFKLTASKIEDLEDGYKVEGNYTYDDVDSKNYSGVFEIKYSTLNNKDVLTSIVFN